MMNFKWFPPSLLPTPVRAPPSPPSLSLFSLPPPSPPVCPALPDHSILRAQAMDYSWSDFNQLANPTR